MRAESYIEMARVENTHWWFVARREILAKVLAQCDLPQSSSILEIGCGTGGNLSLLAGFGQVDAVEMDQNAISLASEKVGSVANIQQGKCPEDIPFGDKKYDLICLFDVLEHIENDEASLLALKKRLNPNGTIIITVPAYQWLWSQHDENLHHKRRYSMAGLVSLSAAAGLNFSTATYFNSLLFPLAVIARVLDRVTSSELASEAPPPVFLNWLFKNVFRMERFFIGKFTIPFGVSILLKLHLPVSRD